jgi:hypothetical protein
MIVLQGSVEGGRLVLWGEARPEGRPKGRKPRAARPSTTWPSPFDPGPDQLRRAIEEALGGDGSGNGRDAGLWSFRVQEESLADLLIGFEDGPGGPQGSVSPVGAGRL